MKIALATICAAIRGPFLWQLSATHPAESVVTSVSRHVGAENNAIPERMLNLAHMTPTLSREERGEGEAINRRCRIKLNPSR